MTAKKALPLFQVGDRVKIRHSDWRGRIVEFRGPLAPGGVFVYRVRVPHKPKPIYIELREDQLLLLPTPPQGNPSPYASQAPEIPRQQENGSDQPKVKPSPFGKKRAREERKRG
jgi:hypothetical protein